MGRFSNDPKRYICRDYERIENYAETLCSDKKWEIHHRLETNFSDGTRRPVNCQITSAELKALKMYYDRPADELIFLSKSDHASLHNTGRVFSEEHCAKISNRQKGKALSEEHRAKLKAARAHRVYKDYDAFIKKCKEHSAHKGPQGFGWFTNGIDSVYSQVCPDGWHKGRIFKRGVK